MTPSERLFGYQHAFDHPVSLGIAATLAIVLAVYPLVHLLLAKRLKPEFAKELWERYITWLILVPLLIGPILLGAAWTMGMVLAIALLSFEDYARATGIFRDRAVYAVVVLGILVEIFAAVDHWYGLFMAAGPLMIGLLAAIPIAADQPKGYIQRVALGVFAFALFGSALGHLAFMANDVDYRPRLLMLIVAVELNDVFAFTCGKLFGRTKLAPNTSPNKTREGALGALILTTTLVYLLSGSIFEGTVLAHPAHRIVLGLLISGFGQLGDLMLSSIKRDLGIKDMGSVLPGHGGFLDRFNSLLLVSPVVFHYINTWIGWGVGEPIQLMTGR